MAQGPMISILVTIRIQESEVRNPDSLDYRKSYRDFDEILWRAWVWHSYILVTTRITIRFRDNYAGVRRRSVLSEYF